MQKRLAEGIKKYRLDIIVISVILILSLSVLLIVTLTRNPGAVAVVEINGTKVAEYPLGIDGTYVLNNGTNILVIENSVAYLTYSDCPDHRCQKNKLQYVGQNTTCLPNLVSITIKGEAEGGVDF